MRSNTLERVALWGVPGAVLLAAYAGICAMTGSLWPWNAVVHEDGQRTLFATVFFVEHATRELVPDMLLALAAAGSVHYFFPATIASAAATRWRVWLGLLTVATLSAIVLGTVWTDGRQALMDNLSQLHTRPGAALVWGAHWRYHFIERFALVLLAFTVTGIVWILRGKPQAERPHGRARLYGLAWILFALTTVLFGVTREPFQDPAYLGHQLRELFTHALVTLPLALGTCLALTNQPTSPERVRSRDAVWPIVLTGVISVASGVFLLAASILADAQSHGQTTGLAPLLFPHFAEHAAGYVLVPALAGFAYLLVRPGSRIRT